MWKLRFCYAPAKCDFVWLLACFLYAIGHLMGFVSNWKCGLLRESSGFTLPLLLSLTRVCPSPFSVAHNPGNMDKVDIWVQWFLSLAPSSWAFFLTSCSMWLLGLCPLIPLARGGRVHLCLFHSLFHYSCKLSSCKRQDGTDVRLLSS